MKKHARRVLKKTAAAPRLGMAVAGRRKQTRQEIFSQPETWVETARQFEQNGSLLDFAKFRERRAIAVCGLRVELLPFADDRGAVGKASGRCVHGSACIGTAFRAAGGDAADRGAASGACFALGQDDGSFARGGMAESEHSSSNARRDLQHDSVLEETCTHG